MKLSLRGRLGLWYVLAIPALIFALAFIAQRIMVGNLRASLDDTLRDRSQLVTSAIRADLGAKGQSYDALIDDLVEQDFQSIPLLLRVADSRGNVIGTFGKTPESIIPPMDRQLRRARLTEGAFFNVRIKGVEAVRIYTAPVQDVITNDTLAIVQTGESLVPLDAAQNQLWIYAVVVGVAGSLLTLTVGMVILHRGLRPLDRILRRVAEVESKDLQEGLPEESRPPELQKLALSLNSMWRRLDAAFKAKQVFVASISHDLRTPLTALQGQIEVVLMEPSTTPEVRESLERMAGEVRRLIRMTNNLLLNTQLESHPPMPHQPVDLGELLEEVVAQVYVLAEGLEMDFDIQRDIVVEGDHDLLKQMTLNIIDNAIKFTPRGGSIRVSLKHDGDAAVVQVADTGRGIPEKHLARVLEPFYRAERSRGSNGGGAGLGLAIVRNVVQLHHGQVDIQSAEGKGTTVTIRLPLAPAGEAASRAAELPEKVGVGSP